MMKSETKSLPTAIGTTTVNNDEIFNQRQAQDYSKLSYHSLLRAEKAGRIKVARVGTKKLYKKSEINRFLFGE